MNESDFRVLAARRKRERMRTRLLDATMEVCGQVGHGERAVIDDVIRAADVSRGTFYKYFASLNEARRALGQHLTNELVESVGPMFVNVTDPTLRTAAGWILIMSRAVGDPAWGAFALRTEHFNEDSHLLAAVRRNTLAGQKTGSFQIEHVEAAIDFQMGVALEGMRRLLQDSSKAASYIVAITTMGLRGLGVEEKRAAEVARAAMDDVTARAPDFLPWWRPVD